MQTTIGDFDPATHQVEATFVGADSAGEAVTFRRQVNACLDKAGAYDPEATQERVAQVALGVQAKMALGVVTNAPPPSAAEEVKPDETAEGGEAAEQPETAATTTPEPTPAN